MKNEDKIIELLLEYIARTDRMEKEFKEEMVALRRDFNQSNFRQEVLMKDILRLSKKSEDLRPSTKADSPGLLF